MDSIPNEVLREGFRVGEGGGTILILLSQQQHTLAINVPVRITILSLGVAGYHGSSLSHLPPLQSKKHQLIPALLLLVSVDSFHDLHWGRIFFTAVFSQHSFPPPFLDFFFWLPR